MVKVFVNEKSAVAVVVCVNENEKSSVSVDTAVVVYGIDFKI